MMRYCLKDDSSSAGKYGSPGPGMSITGSIVDRPEDRAFLPDLPEAVRAEVPAPKKRK